MNILLSNDDGVYAPGLQALAKALAQIGEVTVIAPDRNRSGASNSLTLEHPLRIKQLENGFISVEGTPTDCVHLALTGLLPEKPDIVVSGINSGANLGDDVFYSGTVAAAMEGCFMGLPALAFSLAGTELQHFTTAAEVAKQLVLQLREKPLPPKTILNVNVPDIAWHDLKGVVVTRLGTRHIAEPILAEKDPRGNVIYWIGPAGPEQDAGDGTDFYAVNNNQVSVTPLRLDLTHYELMPKISGWLTGLEL